MKKDTSKTLIINLCSKEDSLHTLEFVKPITDILDKNNDNYKIIHFSKINPDTKELNKYNKIILTGTSLSDFSYLEKNNLDKFNFLKEFKGDILGICAGAQVLGLIYECEISQKTEIGLINIEIIKEDKLFENVNFKEIYSLHKNYIKPNNNFEILIQNEIPQILKLKNNTEDNQTKTNKSNIKKTKNNNNYDNKNKNVYLVSFHPEVRNKQLIINFLNL